jgi:hypothetical protein
VFDEDSDELLEAPERTRMTDAVFGVVGADVFYIEPGIW